MINDHHKARVRDIVAHIIKESADPSNVLKSIKSKFGGTSKESPHNSAYLHTTEHKFSENQYAGDIITHLKKHGFRQKTRNMAGTKYPNDGNLRFHRGHAYADHHVTIHTDGGHESHKVVHSISKSHY